jgi:hypothetical protein
VYCLQVISWQKLQKPNNTKRYHRNEMDKLK